jgi:hypothetical protein
MPNIQLTYTLTLMSICHGYSILMMSAESTIFGKWSLLAKVTTFTHLAVKKVLLKLQRISPI